jgi:hypothetical protein
MMKSKTILFFLFATVGIVFATLSVATPSAQAAKPREALYRGDIIDTHCLEAHKADLAKFMPTHTKECVLMPDCQASGMNLRWSNGTVLKFDNASNLKIIAFLKEQDSKLQVVVRAVKNPDNTYSLISIKNQ